MQETMQKGILTKAFEVIVSVFLNVQLLKFSETKHSNEINFLKHELQVNTIKAFFTHNVQTRTITK